MLRIFLANRGYISNFWVVFFQIRVLNNTCIMSSDCVNENTFYLKILRHFRSVLNSSGSLFMRSLKLPIINKVYII